MARGNTNSFGLSGLVRRSWSSGEWSAEDYPRRDARAVAFVNLTLLGVERCGAMMAGGGRGMKKKFLGLFARGVRRKFTKQNRRKEKK